MQLVSGWGLHSSSIKHASNDALRCGWLADVTDVMWSSWTPCWRGLNEVSGCDHSFEETRGHSAARHWIGFSFSFAINDVDNDALWLALVNDGPRPSGCGWPVAVGVRMAQWSSACGWPSGRLLADGPVVVCGWPGSNQGRLLADGPRSSANGLPRVVQGRLRMASRLSSRLPRGSR